MNATSLLLRSSAMFVILGLSTRAGDARAQDNCGPMEACTSEGGPTNDSLACATEIPCMPFADARDVAAANDEDPTFGAASVWYTFTPVESGWVRFDTAGSDSTMVVILFAGEVSSESSMVAAGYELAMAELEAGVTYSLVILRPAEPTPGEPHMLRLAVGPDAPLEPPVNDAYFDALPMTEVPGLIEQDIAGATGDTEPEPVPVPTVWYEYVPSEDGTLVLDASASSTEIGIQLFTLGDGGAMTPGPLEVGRLEVPVTAGQAHYVMFAALGSPGSLLVSLDGPAAEAPCHAAEVCTSAPEPTNDALACASDIPCLPFRDRRDASAASIGVDVDFGLPTVWYTYTPGADGAVRFDTTGSAGEAPIVIGIFEGQDVTDGSYPMAFGVQSAVAVLTGGTTYTIALLFQDAPGRLVLRADAVALAVPPPNDLIADATPIELPNTYVQDISGATGTDTDPFYNGALPSVWYTFAAAEDGAIKLDATQSDGEIDINAFRLQDGELVDASWATGKLVVNVAAGETYFVMLNPLGVAGQLVLSVEATPPRPPNDMWWQWRSLGYPFRDEMNVTNATPWHDDPYPAEGRNTVWYGLNPSFTGTVRFDTAGSDGQPDLALFWVDLTTDNIYGMDDYRLLAYGAGSLEWEVEAGLEYRVMVMPNDTTNLVMSMGPLPPANEDIATATEVDVDALPFVDDVYTWQDGWSPDEPLTHHATTVWYRITPSRSLVVAASATGPYWADIELAWFEGAPSEASRLPWPPASVVNAPLEAGTTYYLGVSSNGLGSFAVRFEAGVLLPNDEPGGATVVTDLPFAGALDRRRLTAAPADPDIDWIARPPHAVSAWYLFTPQHDMSFAMVSDEATAVGVFVGGPGAWTRVAQSGPVTGAVESVALEAGVTYAILVETDPLALGTARVAFGEGDYAGARVSGTIRWAPIKVRSGQVTLTDGDYTTPGELVIAPDGLSATYSARTAFPSGAYRVEVTAQSCLAGFPCGQQRTRYDASDRPFLVVDPGTRLVIRGPAVALGLSDDVVVDLGRPLASACGVIDNGDRGQDVSFDSWSSGAGMEVWDLGRPAADGSYCTPAVPGAGLQVRVASAPAECTVVQLVASEVLYADVPVSATDVTLPIVSFAVPQGTIRVTAGFEGQELFQQLATTCLDEGPCLSGCNTHDDDLLFGFDGLVQSTLRRIAGAKRVLWSGVELDYDFTALADLAGSGQDPEDLPAFLAEVIAPLVDALGSFAVYGSNTVVELADGGDVQVDLSSRGFAQWSPTGGAPEGEPDALFHIGVAVVELTSETDGDVQHLARGMSFGFRGLRGFLDAVGEPMPPEVEALDFDIEPRPITLSLAADRDWRLQNYGAVVVDFRDMSVAPDGELQHMDLRVRATALLEGIEGALLGFEVPDEPVLGADLPIGPLVAGELVEPALDFMTPDVADLRIHLPNLIEDATITGAVLVFASEGLTLEDILGAGVASDAVNLVVKLDVAPMSQVSIPLPAGLSRGALLQFQGLDGDEGDEGDGFETELQVEVGPGDQVDQTPHAPFTHALEPQPMETCAPSITFRGRVEDPDGVVEVQVDGVSVELDDEGAFAIEVPLAVGDNTVALMARDAMDDVVYRTRTFQRGVTDSDGDGLTDCEELALADGGACPAIDDVDSDDDGVDDGDEDEVCGAVCVADSDIDGLNDGQEVELGTSACDDDTDDDGLIDGQEQGLCGDPFVADTDGDGLSDGQERDLGTSPCLVDTDHDDVRDSGEAALCGDPLVADTDHDGLNDGQEAALGTSACDADSDDDGVIDGDEAALCGDPLVADTDGDGLLDGREREMRTSVCTMDTDRDGVDDGEEEELCGDPLVADTDGDDLDDGQEAALGTLVCDVDTDDDGINDGREAGLCGDPLAPDTDADGLRDGQEQALGTSLCDADSDDDTIIDGDEAALCGDPRSADTDGDQLDDGQERALGTSPCDVDSDDDGVIDSAEAALCAHPLVADTDGDGLTDGQERALGTSPCVTDSDGDGWGDALDPDPTSGDVRASLARLLSELGTALRSAPVSAFLGQNDVPRERRRQAMVTLAATAAQCALGADLACVRSHVRTLADRTDGAGDVDWVVDEAIADDLYERCDDLLTLLGLLP
ncbi:MAG: hypothetical protein IT385_02885 [Deltaproteobacteria bacterium]|nr:hypothetical protein [Deltaproteobacteria bacterium]